VKHVRELLLDSDTPVWITRKSIQQFLHDKLCIHRSIRSLSKWLDKWGLEWQELKRPPAGALNATRMELMRRFLIQIDYCIRMGYFLGSQDESYANQRLSKSMSFAPRGQPYGKWAPTSGGGLGQRVCFLAVLMEAGILGDLNDMAAVGDIDSDHAHSFTIFMAKEAGHVGDYHGNFDWPVFYKWVMHRLFPALTRCYPNCVGPYATETVAIIMDNASYHLQSTDCIDNFHPETVKRSQLIEWMDNAGCKQIDVQHSYVRDQIKYSAKFNYLMTDDGIPNRGKAGSVAYMEEVRHACVKWLIDNKPDVLENDLERACRKFGNVRIVWNIPNFPEGAPIEHVWARCKSYAAQKWEGRRRVSELASHIYYGLFTDKLADPVFSEVRGGNFGWKGGEECPSAKKLWEHMLYSEKGGCRIAINKVPGLLDSSDNHIGALQVDEIARDDALKHWNRASLRFRVKEIMADLAEADVVLEELDDDDNDSDVDCEYL